MDEAIHDAGSVRAINSFDEALKLGIAAREADDFWQAIRYHNRALELARSKGDRLVAHAALAATYRRTGRPEEALAELHRSIALEPSKRKNHAAYTSLVAVLVDLHRLDEARAQGEELVRIRANDAHVHKALGRLFRGLSHRESDPALLEQAETHFLEAARLEPKRRDIHEELRSLVDARRKLVHDISDDNMKMGFETGTRELERHIARIERRRREQVGFRPEADSA